MLKNTTQKRVQLRKKVEIPLFSESVLHYR